MSPTSRFSFCALFGGILLELAAGCASSKPDAFIIPVAPPGSIPDDFLIIDMHSHNFNARDIPVRNIALGRRDAAPPWTWLATDGMAKLLAAAIVSETPESDPQRRVLQQAKAPAQNMVETAVQMGVKPTKADKSPRRAQHQAVEKALRQRRTGERAPVGLKERIVLRSVRSVVSPHPPGTHRTEKANSTDVIGGFLDDLTSNHEELASRYFQENVSQVALRIVHMMDMGPTYGQTNNEGHLRPIDEQVLTLQRLQKNRKWRMTYFVSYNPFRDNANSGEALDKVKDAILHHGAYGVKIYPPAGYRAISNSIPSRPRPWFTAWPGREWEARYRSNGQAIKPEELDRRILDLLIWCADSDIPIFVHSGYGEFQARSGYGHDMPDPRWWKGLLEKESPAHPQLKNIRLCFGHSGGGDSFFGDKEFLVWSQTVADLCCTYPNIFCEVGCLDQILYPEKRAAFIKSIEGLCPPQGPDPSTFSFATKITYGSDWFMPLDTGISRDTFIAAYREAFRQIEKERPDLGEIGAKFFYWNALDFLDASRRIGVDQNLDPTTKAQLRILCDRPH